MSHIFRAAGVIYIILVGVAIAVHFIIRAVLSCRRCAVCGVAAYGMNWFIAPAVLIMLAASYVGKRRFDGEGSQRN